ncbi:rhodanese-like domain-containing protein [Candidatus Woesearchaeota archaeon]|nr:rhodanese-like domain-containing protein [Candidatus Woesearchaeota archaeon]
MVGNKTTSQLKAALEQDIVDIVLIDCRTEGEYQSGHIDGSILIPLNTISQTELDKHKISKDAKTYIICRSGARSMFAAQMMEKMGYTDVSNVVGGMLDWSD